MKYFTSASLTLLTLNSLFLAVSASGTDGPIVAPDTSVPAPAGGSSFIDDASRTIHQVVHAVKTVFTTPKNLIKASLQVPSPLDTASIVPIGPSEAVCQVGNAREFWTALFKAEGRANIEKVIFCPGAVSYLKDLDSAKLLKNAKDDKLRAILNALMLRQVTLIGKYSTNYMDSNYLSCYNALWDRVQSTTAGTEFWPCTATACEAAGIKTNFTTFVVSTPACSAVLKDQLDAYADRVAEAATVNKITMATVLRDAILENLTSAPHFSLPIYAVYDSVLEMDKNAAAERIKKALEDVKGTLETQSTGTSTVYSDAEKCFNVRLSGLEATKSEPKAVEVADAKTAEVADAKAVEAKSEAIVESSSNSTPSTSAEPKSSGSPPPTETDKTVSSTSEAKDSAPEPTASSGPKTPATKTTE